MKKNIMLKILSVLLVVTLLGGWSPVVQDQSPNAKNPGMAQTEMRGVWISFLEMQTMLQGKTEAVFTKNIQIAMDNIKDFGLNTVFVQVRPYADALYPSKLFPWSHIVTGTEGKDPGFDPLQIMVQEAHSRGLKIEAWINPYRVRAIGSKKPLASSNIAKKWLASGDNSVIQYKEMISFNPASVKAQNYIVDGVKEILQNYAVDGIHIDDYFYPITGTSFDQTFDKTEYQAYQKSGGKLSLGDWRRSNVESLLRKLYSAVKEVNPKATFGISPQSSLENNYNAQYLDVKKIVSNKGYCDYVMPQIYFGFDNERQPFAKTLDTWNDLIKVAEIDLYVGLGTYKIGTYDGYAGAGKNEWINHSDRMAQMILYSREKTHYKGFAIYRYDHLFRPEQKVVAQVQKERTNLKEIL